ncbi:hypothetical protein ABBQ32_003808 [Trebouxia sp. C0010 RCD-2024]
MKAIRKQCLSFRRSSNRAPVSEDTEAVARSATAPEHGQDPLYGLSTSWFGTHKGTQAALQAGAVNISADATASHGAVCEQQHAAAQPPCIQVATSERVHLSESGQLDDPDGPQVPAAGPLLHQPWAQQVTPPLPSAQRTIGVQAEGSAGQDLTPSTTSAAVQTDRQGEQQVVVAQQGRLPLSKDHLKTCKAITSLLQKATQKARDGYVARAEQDVCTALHQHEEDLLVVLGNVPLDGFHLGSFLDACTLAPSPQATLQNSQRLLQAVPGHFLGRLGQALSCSLLDQDQPGGAPLQPTKLAPGPLGIASAACGFIQVAQAKLKEVKADLLGANAKCGKDIASMVTDESAWEPLKEARDEVHRQHGAAMATIRGRAEPRHWCASLRAAGNMLVGDFDQAESICNGLLREYKGEGYPLWAHLIMWYARLHTSVDVLVLQQIGAELHKVVKEARQASLVHLAPHALPNLPKDAVSFIQKVEDTATAVNQLAQDYEGVSMLVDRLETWTSLSKEDKEKYIKEGVETCNRMLDGTYAGRSLSVRVTARLYALRANLHCHQGSYLLADADRAYSLCLDPFQHRVLDHWLQQLRLAYAYKAEACVIAMAKDAVRDCYRSGEYADTDQAYRRGLLARAECAQQHTLPQTPDWLFPSLMTAECWKFYCGSGAQNGHKYLLLMSPDKVALRAGDFGSHMGLQLAYIPQVISSAMADHYGIMGEIFLYHKDRKPAQMPVLHCLDLGPASQPPSSQAADYGSPAREDSQPGSPDSEDSRSPERSEHAPADSGRFSPAASFAAAQQETATAPLADAKAATRTDTHPHAGASQPGSPDSQDRRSPELSEHAPADSGRFSPVYRATSPSFSPRGSEGLDCMPGPAAGLDEATSFTAAQQETATAPLADAKAATRTDTHPHAGASTESEQGCSDQEIRGSSKVEKAADPRPATARGHSAPRSGSRFCFARPAAAQAQVQGDGAAASPAASTEDPAPGSTQVSSDSSRPQVPAEGLEGPAADVSTTLESTPLVDSAHTPIDDASMPAAAAEVAQELAKHMQAEPVSPAADFHTAEATPQPTFVWSQAEPPADQTSSNAFFSTTAGTAPFGSAQAGGSFPKHPNSFSRKAAGRQQATARGRSAAKQAGNVPTSCESPAWASGAASMHAFQFGAASSQSGVGPDIKLPNSGVGAAEDSHRTAFTFAGNSSSLQVPAEGPDQHPAADLSSTPESTLLGDSAHSPIGIAAVPAAAAACTQAPAKHMQAEPLPAEPVSPAAATCITGACSTHDSVEDATSSAADAGAAQEVANHVQAESLPAEPLPSDPVSPKAMPTFVWCEDKPAASQNSSSSFLETRNTSPAFGAQAAGSSLRQPSSHSRKGRRQAQRQVCRQAGRQCPSCQ